MTGGHHVCQNACLIDSFTLGDTLTVSLCFCQCPTSTEISAKSEELKELPSLSPSPSLSLLSSLLLSWVQFLHVVPLVKGLCRAGRTLFICVWKRPVTSRLWGLLSCIQGFSKCPSYLSFLQAQHLIFTLGFFFQRASIHLSEEGSCEDKHHIHTRLWPDVAGTATKALKRAVLSALTRYRHHTLNRVL